MPTIHVPPQYPTELDKVKIAFVAEAPSTEEVEKGIPLVGPSGRIFNSMLATAGLDRSEFFVTNVFDEKLPGNNVAAWCVDLKTAREQKLTDLPPIGAAGFLKQEHRWQLERLKQELLDVRPDVIVPLGGTALWAFTGSSGIAGQRGSIVSASHVIPGAKLLPTFHPAAVMHQWKFFSVVVGDFIKANMEALRGPKIILPERRLMVEPILSDIEAILPTLLSSDLLSVDIETGWGQITCLGFAPDSDTAICIPFVDRRNASRSYWSSVEEEVKAWGLVKQVMESDTPKLGQNFGGYDAYWFLEKMDIQPRNLRHDTRLIHHTLYPELPKSLEFMGASYTSQGAWKGWGKRQMEKKDD